MATATAAAATHLLLRRLLPLRLSTTAATPLSLLPKPSFSLLHVTRRPLSATTALCTPQPASPLLEERESEIDLQVGSDGKREEEEEGETQKGSPLFAGPEREVPQLTVKEKKELGSYANSLGDKLKSQQVGKSGVTENVVFALDETLEKNELLKLKIHRSCPGELEDVVSLLERATGSAAVFQIGRTVIFYRPSVTKLKAEQKKEQARRLIEQRRKKALSSSMRSEQQQGRTGDSSRSPYTRRSRSPQRQD